MLRTDERDFKQSMLISQLTGVYLSFGSFKDVDRHFQNGMGILSPLTLLGVDREDKAR